MKPHEEIFPKEAQLMREGVCPFCKKPILTKDFRNEISRTESKISGLCQSCQDEVFGED